MPGNRPSDRQRVHILAVSKIKVQVAISPRLEDLLVEVSGYDYSQSQKHLLSLYLV